MWGLQPDLILQVTLVPRLELCPCQSLLCPEMSQRVQCWLRSHQSPRSGDLQGSHREVLAQRRQRHLLKKHHGVPLLLLLLTPALRALPSGPASAPCWKPPGSMAWHCPRGATRLQALISPHPAHSCWVARAKPCSTGCKCCWDNHLAYVPTCPVSVLSPHWATSWAVSPKLPSLKVFPGKDLLLSPGCCLPHW